MVVGNKNKRNEKGIIMKCFVKPCKNHDHQGHFSGQVCIPCLHLAQDIKKGKLDHSYNFGEGVVQFIVNNWKEIVKRGYIFSPNSTHYIHIGPGKSYKIHIFKVFKTHEGQVMVIYRWYGRHKQWWHYVMVDAELLKMQIQRVKNKKSL